MSGSVRKRKSLLDSKEETQLPAETSEKTARRERKSYSSHHGNDKKWSELDVSDVWEPEDGSGWPYWEPSIGNSGQKDDSISRGFNEIRRTTRDPSRDKNGDRYTDFDGLEQQNVSHSAEKRYSESRRYRKRSRSRGRGRSGSRGWDGDGSRSRSRSRSLLYRHESCGWSERPGSRLSSQICRDYTAGECRKGSQCRFLHHGSLNPKEGRQSETDRSERWRHRQESREALDYACNEGPRDYYPRHKISDGYEDYDDRERSESRRSSSKSTFPCNDFLKGRCYRGSSCRYPHHGVSGVDYERSNRNTSFVHRQKHHPSNIRCKFFALGRCHRDDCRFSHEGAAGGNREGRSLNDRFRHNLEDDEKSWNGPKWGDENGISDVSKSSGLGDRGSRNASHNVPTTDEKWTDDKWGHKSDREIKPCNWPKWGEATGVSGVPKPSAWGSNNDRDMHFAEPATTQKSTGERCVLSLDDQSRMCSSLSSKDKAAARDEYPSPRFGNGSNDANTEIPKSAGVAKLLDKEERPLSSQSLYPETLGGISMHIHGQDTAQEALGQQLDATVMRPVLPENSNIQLHSMNRRDDVLITDGSNALIKDNASGSTAFPVLVPEQSFNQSGDNLGSLPQSSCRTDESQHMISLNSSNGHVIGTDEPFQQLFSPLNSQDKTQIHHEEFTKTLQMPELKIPDVNSEIPQASETVAQRTNFPASLTQIFGKGQLPQLYTDLNSPAPTRLVPSRSNSANHVPPVDSMDDLPDPARRSLEQCDHISDIIKSSKPSNSNRPDEEKKLMTLEQLHGSFNDKPDSSIIPKHDVSEEECQGSMNLSLNLQQQLHGSFNDKPDSSKIQKHGGSGEECRGSVNLSLNLQQQKPVSNSEGEESNKVNTEKGKQEQEQETNHQDNVNACGRVEEGNGAKDEKEMRLFKIALVEFVKEILKPTWKEGQMSREVHKAVVKKVVDKVLSTIQGANFPKTQDKIEEYLSYSKPKLTKLVQAYVEILMKK